VSDTTSAGRSAEADAARGAFDEGYGPWALIAGASDGIGERFAHGLARRGLNVALLARREPVLADVARAIEAEHGRSEGLRSGPSAPTSARESVGSAERTSRALQRTSAV